jgi:hypothetical protein
MLQRVDAENAVFSEKFFKLLYKYQQNWNKAIITVMAKTIAGIKEKHLICYTHVNSGNASELTDIILLNNENGLAGKREYKWQR